MMCLFDDGYALRRLHVGINTFSDLIFGFSQSAAACNVIRGSELFTVLTAFRKAKGLTLFELNNNNNNNKV